MPSSRAAGVPDTVAVPLPLLTRLRPWGRPLPLMTGGFVLHVVTVNTDAVPAVMVSEPALMTTGGSQFAAGTVTENGADVTTLPWGLVPDAVAALVTDPALRSPWVTAYEPVQVSEPPGVNVADGQVTDVTGVPPTETPVRVVVPVSVTRSLNATVWPAEP